MKKAYDGSRKSLGYDRGGAKTKPDSSLKPEAKKFGKRKATKS
jgi:hypothetical protein